MKLTPPEPATFPRARDKRRKLLWHMCQVNRHVSQLCSSTRATRLADLQMRALILAGGLRCRDL